MQTNDRLISIAQFTEHMAEVPNKQASDKLVDFSN